MDEYVDFIWERVDQFSISAIMKQNWRISNQLEYWNSIESSEFNTNLSSSGHEMFWFFGLVIFISSGVHTRIRLMIRIDLIRF